MRIAVLNSFYRSEQPSGENIAVMQQVSALRDAGIEVYEVFRYSDDLEEKPLFKVRSAFQVATGFDWGGARNLIKDMQLDLIHVHNTFPNFGTRWLSKINVPIVTTLHNFRTSCANGLLYRDGRVCVDCPATGSQASLKHACYRDSRLATLPLTIGTKGGAKRNPLLLASDSIITQSLRAHSFMWEQGIPQAKLHLVPGFVEERHSGVVSPPSQPRFLFVGRNSPEKGLSQLLTIWPQQFELDVIGTDNTLEAPTAVKGSVQLLGMRSQEDVTSVLPSYSGLIFPGRVWEGAYPMVVREALEAGVPVVALEGSGAADLIKETGAGAIYREGSADQLEWALRLVITSSVVMRATARNVFQDDLRKEQWVEKMISVFVTEINQ
jgi:glycosyltransferase involved in cell wall biosynthesis